MKIVHLIDDQSNRDIAAFLSRVKNIRGEHSVIEAGSWKFMTRRFDADVIISHLTVSWRRLPFLISLRNRHPGARLMHVEHTYCEGYVNHNFKSDGRLFNLLRIAYSLFNRVVAISKGQGRWLLAGSLAPVSRLLIIPYVTDIKDISHKSRRFAEDRPLRLLHGGDYSHGSGVDILLDAFSGVQDTQLHLAVAGAEALPARHETLIRDDERITYIPAHDLNNALYADADIVALPSRWQVNSKLAQEAWAAGCVVISSGVDGLAEQSVSSEPVFGTDVESWKYGLENLRSLPLAALALEGRQRVLEEEAVFSRRWSSLLSDPEKLAINEAEIRDVLRAQPGTVGRQA